jgi:hypothetical protein
MKIQLVCSACGNTFEKEKGEYNRRIKLGSVRFFCNSSCAGKVTGGWKDVTKNTKKNGTWYDISKHAGNKKDIYNQFRTHFRRIKNRERECNITLKDLKEQWDSQSGKCAYSKVSLISANLDKKHNIPPFYLASVDRIDSSKGYVKGNIQWVSATMNYAKSNMTHEETLEFCKIFKTI